MEKIGALIPIRLNSERLPAKSLLKINGRPILYHLLDRISSSTYIADKKQIVICTTNDDSDDPLVDAVQEYGSSIFRGSADDIIKRFHDAMNVYDFDAVIQVDGDDPLCDPLYMDLTMEKLLSDPSLDIVFCDGLPLGIASKSFTRRAMEKVFEHYQTEHNDTGFIYFFTKTGLCKQSVITPIKPGHVHNEIRLTLDYQEDYELFKAIFEKLYHEGEIFFLDDVLNLVRQRPDLLEINGKLNEQYWTRTREKAKLEFKDEQGKTKPINI